MPQNSPTHIFTRRHYIWLASAMRDAKSVLERVGGTTKEIVDQTFKVIAFSLADSLAAESEYFDRERFLAAIFHAGEIHD